MGQYSFLDDYPLTRVRVSRRGVRATAECIIDTGSPYTILPKGILRHLALDDGDMVTTIEIHGIIDKKECAVVVPAFAVDLACGDLVLSPGTVLMYDFHDSLGLLGHNILSKGKLVIDWKARSIELSRTPRIRG